MKLSERLGIKKSTLPTLSYVPINRLTPNPLQPRKAFDGEELRALAHSIKENGVLQPLCIKEREDLPTISINGQVVTAEAVYEIIAGERRWRAARLAGLEKVPCIIMKAAAGDSARIALTENFYRKDLSFFELAYAMQSIMLVCGLTQAELAESMGVSQPMVANKLRLLKFSDEERRIITDCHISERLCRLFLRVENESARLRLLRLAEAHGLNAEQCEARIDAYLKGAPTQQKHKKGGAAPKIVGTLSDIRFFINSVDKAVGMANAAGFEVEREEKDLGDFYEVHLIIPKSKRKA